MANDQQRQRASKVLFVQGAGSEGAHACDAKLVASLEEKLGRNVDVRYPRMPDEGDPDFGAWKRCIAGELAKLGNDTVLVGHSFGASVLIKILADAGLEQNVAGAFLISAPYWSDDAWKWREMELPVDAADRLPSGVPLFLYHGSEDETVPVSHLEMYARKFPKAVVRTLAGRDHQLNDDLTEVADDIASLRR
jgi:predicted alpha/beta hydrolase family esterase